MSVQNNATEITAHVGEAWSQHYKGNNDAALSQFKQLVASAPNHIDANYGLALCLKMAGQKDAARGAFEATQKLVQSQIGPDEEENVRYQMIARMIDQHLAQLQ